jgi:hypothetical protein
VSDFRSETLMPREPTVSRECRDGERVVHVGFSPRDTPRAVSGLREKKAPPTPIRSGSGQWCVNSPRSALRGLAAGGGKKGDDL